MSRDALKMCDDTSNHKRNVNTHLEHPLRSMLNDAVRGDALNEAPSMQPEARCYFKTKPKLTHPPKPLNPMVNGAPRHGDPERERER
jgi:hypothetical protein